MQAPGDLEGFLGDASSDLGVAGDAVGKCDRNFLYEKSRLPRPVVHLQLERISSGRNRCEVDLLERRLPPALEAARRIPDRHSSDGADEDSAADADDFSVSDENAEDLEDFSVDDLSDLDLDDDI